MLRTAFVFALLLSLTLVGCAKGGGGYDGGSAPAATASGGGGGGGDQTGGGGDQTGGGTQKSLFSQWTASDGTFAVDLRTCAFDQGKTATASSPFLGSCSCTVTPTGTEASGSMKLESCTGASACSQMNRTITYTKTNTQLTACFSSSNCQTMN